MLALSFCPVTGGLYFLGLIPLAVQYESPLLLPLVFGVAAALPVAFLAALLAGGARRLAAVFDRLTAWQWWAQRVTGTVFILAGIYYCLHYVFEVV